MSGDPLNSTVCPVCGGDAPPGAAACARCADSAGADTVLEMPALHLPRPQLEPQQTEPQGSRDSPAQRTMFLASPPSLGLAHPPAPAPAPAAPPIEAPARVSSQPGSETLLHMEAGEILAAARIATATSAARREASERRTRSTLKGLLAVALVAAIAGLAWRVTSRRFDARAVAPGGAPGASTLTVSRTDAGYEVRVGIVATQAARLELPTGATRVTAPAELAPDEPVEVKFTLPDSTLQVGDNDLTLRVVPMSADTNASVPLRLAVRVAYRFSVVEADAPLAVDVQVMQGWRVKASGASVEPISANVWRVAWPHDLRAAALERAAPDAKTVELPLALALDGPAGERLDVQERLTLRVPDAPVALLEPAAQVETRRASLRIAGRSLPGARVMLGENALSVDPEGRFEGRWEVAPGGPHTVELAVTAAGHRRMTRALRVTRIDAASDARARRAFDATSGSARPLMLTEASASEAEALRGQRVRVVGRVLSTQSESSPEGDTTAVQLSVCRGDCPVFARVSGVVRVVPGEDALVEGTVAAPREYTTQAGRTLTALVLDAAQAVPR